jgi:hypothetical protein
MVRFVSCAAGAAGLLVGVHAAGAAADGSSARLPAQVWGISLGRPAPAGVLAAARRAGVNALILDRHALGAGARASLYRGAAGAGLPVYEPADVGRARTRASRQAGREECRRAHRATQPCLLFAPAEDALGALARVAGVDALVLRLRAPALLLRLELPPRVRVIALVDGRDASSAAWNTAVRAAAAGGRLDLAAAPAGADWQAALGSFLAALEKRAGAPPEPAIPPPPPAAPAAPTALAAVVAPQSVALSWVATPGIGAYEVSVDGGPPRAVTGTSATLEALTCGKPYAFAVRAVAANGDRSAPGTVSATPSPCGGGGGASSSSSVSPPTVVVSAGPASVTRQTAATFSFSGTGTQLACALDGGAFGACSTPQGYSGLGEGAHIFHVRATDAAGTTGPTTDVRWTIDLTAPAAPPRPQAVSIAQTSVSLGWTASTDNLAVTGYTVLRDGVQVGTTAATALTVSGFAGCTTTTFTLTARDAAGNTSAAGNPLTVTTAGCPAAGVFVAPGGSDAAGNTCTTPASPCRRFQAAFDRAAAGAVVEVAGGTYPSQDIVGDRGGLVTFRPAAGATVTMGGTLFIGTPLAGGAKHLKLVDFHFPRSDPHWELAVEPCNDDITLENSTGRRFFILEGNSNITFKGGSWGGYATPNDEDSGIGTSNGVGVADPAGLAKCGGATAGPARNIVFDGVTFHDVFWNTGCTDTSVTCTLPFGITCSSAIGTCSDGWGGSHPDCLEINGYVNGVTIENSTFVHCGNTMLVLYTDQGNIDNVVVRNNTFRDMAPTSYYGLQWTDTTEGFTCSGDKFLNNTYLPNAGGGWLANTPPRFECSLAPGGIPTEVAGNTFQEAPQTQDCARSKTRDPGYTPAHVYNTNWHGNVYQTTTAGETACTTP